MAEQSVPFPVFLDSIAAQLVKDLKSIKTDTLKPAILADITKVLERVMSVQQAEVYSYQLAVMNYEQMMGRIVGLEQQLEQLSVKLAGYQRTAEWSGLGASVMAVTDYELSVVFAISGYQVAVFAAFD